LENSSSTSTTRNESESKSSSSASTVFLRGKKKPDSRNKECPKRYLCIKEYDKHTHPEEISNFFDYRSQMPSKYWHNFKLLSCPSPDASSHSASDCVYAHGTDDSFCIKCKEWGHVLTFHKQYNAEVVELLQSQVLEALSTLAKSGVGRCESRYRCTAQLGCPLEHSLEERAYFHSFSGKFAPSRVKTVRCPYGSDCLESDMGCDYAHGAEDSYCAKCRSWGHLSTAHDSSSSS
jgi:hypothetical protein